MAAPTELSPHSMPSLNALRAFETAARHMSFKDAASELHVSASAIGHLIADLEEFFGIKLFERAHRRIELTQAGRDLLPGVRVAFDQLRGAVRTFQDYQTDRPLVLSVEPTFASRCLFPRLDSFRALHPDIAPNLLTGDHPLHEPTDLKWHTLIDRNPNTYYSDRANWPRWFKAAGLDQPVYRDRLEVPWEEYAIVSAIQGQGVALASKLLATEDLAAGRLVQPLGVSYQVNMGYYLVSSLASVNDPRVEGFRDWVLDQVDYSAPMIMSEV
ncbi:MAG: LysR family transcriptional regulator [Gammaproteobacteria bacterium]